MRALAILLWLILATIPALAQTTAGSLSEITPAASGFPTPSFLATGLTSWIQTSNSTYCVQDPFSSATFTACEDMSGNGNGFCYDEKPWQPAVSNGGLYFTQTNQQFVSPCFIPGNGSDMFVATQFSAGVTFEIDSVTSASNRQIFDVQNANGNGHKLDIHVTTTGTVVAEASTAGPVTSSAITAGVKHTAIITGDLAAGTITFYLDGTSVGTGSYTATVFAIPPFGVYLGNTCATTCLNANSAFALPLTGYITCFTAHNVTLTAGQVATLQTYLSGSSC